MTMGRDDIVDQLVDYWFHGAKQPHNWTYRGKNLGYRCVTCGLRVSKEELKAATDA